MPSKDTAPKWVHFIAGGTGGCMGALLTCPLEVIKTQFQALHNRRIILASKPKGMPSFFFALKVIVEREGLRGLWKGLGPNLVGVFPSRAIYFGVYNTSKASMLNLGYKEGPLIHLLSAMSAGIAVSTATSPIWLVKTRMQLQTKDSGHLPYKNSWDCVKRVYVEEGVRGFYKGLGASYLGIAESSIQFVLYEKMKSLMIAQKLELQKLQIVDNLTSIPQSSSSSSSSHITLSSSEYMGLAATAKLVAAICTYPHEVLRTRMREQRGSVPGVTPKYTGLLQALKLIFKEEGAAGLYGGMTTHLIRVVPNAAIMFWTYEIVVRYLS